MKSKVEINREEFYLQTGRMLTNNAKIREFTFKLKHLYNFGEEPSKEEVLGLANLIDEYQRKVDTLIVTFREHGVVK